MTEGSFASGQCSRPCITGSANHNKNSTKLDFKKSLEPSHGVLQLLEKNFYSVLLLHLLKPLFSVLHELQALSIFLFKLTIRT